MDGTKNDCNFTLKINETMMILKISNFGPIKDAEFDFKKVNILIGQQGTGKSCVLKIVAFCMWVEKVYLSEEFAEPDIVKKQFVKEHLLDFYKLNDFAVVSDAEYSKIVFNDNDNFKLFIDFEAGKDNWIQIKPISDLTPKHVSYIPAERCLVSVIPNPMDLKLGVISISKYIADWDHAHNLYAEDNKLNILNLNAGFYYDAKTRTDYLSVNDDGVQKNVRFANAASGFQSVVPVCVLTNYYLNHRQQSIKDMLLNRFADNHDNCLLIEEPEENIFPETQYNLVKWLVSALNNGYDNMLFITTHSPYILTAMNNLVYAANVGQDNSKVDEIINRGLWIDAKTIAAYYLEEGSSISIMDEELHEIDPKLIDSISDKINNEYDNIRNIKYGI